MAHRGRTESVGDKKLGQDDPESISGGGNKDGAIDGT